MDECEAQVRQFEVLWAEIARRSNAQQALIAATVTATGTVGGLVVAEGTNAALLLVLALVAPVFGLLWLDHARNIGEIGEFIAKNWRWNPNWEAEYDQRKRTRGGRQRFYVFVAAISIVFLLPAMVGLAASVCQISDGLGLAGWIGGLVLTALFEISWLHQVVRSWPISAATATASTKAGNTEH